MKDQKYEEAISYYQEARQLVEQVKMSSQSVQNKVVLNIVDQVYIVKLKKRRYFKNLFTTSSFFFFTHTSKKTV